MPCNHPASALKLEDVAQAPHQSLRLKFTCGDCLAPITKEYLGHTPEPPSAGQVAASELPYLNY